MELKHRQRNTELTEKKMVNSHVDSVGKLQLRKTLVKDGLLTVFKFSKKKARIC